MLYFFASLLTLPVAYFAPLLLLWALFGYRPSRGEVLRLVAVCLPALQILYALIYDRDHFLIRPVLLVLIISGATLWALRAPLLHRIASLLTALILMVIGETAAYLFMENHYPQFLTDYVPWRTVLLNLIPFTAPYLVVAVILPLRRVRLSHLARPALYGALMVVSPTLLFISGLAVVLEAEQLRVYGPREYGLQPLLLYALLTMLSACGTCGILINVFLRERAKSEALLRYQQTIVNQYDSTRQFRHNYHNTLLMLDGYYRAGDYAALGGLLERMNEEYAAAYSSEYAQGVAAIEDRGIQWLVICKLVHAQSLGIDCAVRVSGSLHSGTLAPAELAEILGVLLDNATEAAARSAARHLGLDITARGDTLVLSVRNSVDAPPDLTRIFDKGYSTKAGHTGLGLYRLRLLLRRYPRSLTDAKFLDGMFIFTVSV